MKSTAKTLLVFVLCVCGGFAARPAAAQTVLNGNYSNSSFNGYTSRGGSYVVVDPATFDNNHNSGLVANADDSDVTLVINGGQFENNAEAGVFAQTNGHSETISITGGTFSGNGAGNIVSTAGPLTITGGTFDESAAGASNITVSGNGPASEVMIEGGVYTGSDVDFLSGNSATLVGYFPGLSLGINTLTGSSIYGQLEYAPAPQTFTYSDGIVIDNIGTTLPGVPEPASLALLSLGGLAMLRRGRSAQ